MNELIKVIETGNKWVVSARELYAYLEMDKSNYARWAKTTIVENPYAVEDEDWTQLVINDEEGEYAIDVTFAKKIAMQSKTPGRKSPLWNYVGDNGKQLPMYNLSKTERL